MVKQFNGYLKILNFKFDTMKCLLYLRIKVNVIN